jgi:MarR family transcriptional regulator, temperature-dependent positive regulator of motility
MIDQRQGISRSPTHLLHQAEQAARMLFSANAVDFTPRQLPILVTVSENEGLNQTEVVELTGIDRSTLGEILTRLVRKGLLQRRRSREDTRAKVLRLTSEGRRLLEAARPMERNVDARLLAVLPKAQREPWKRSVNPARATLVPLPRALGGCLLGSHATWPRPSPTGAPFGVA